MEEEIEDDAQQIEFLDDDVEEEPEELIDDPRYTFLNSFLCRTLKVKPEKWIKLVGNEEYYGLIGKFFKDPLIPLMIIYVNAGNMLQPMYTFPLNNKKKMCYFMRMRPEVLKPNTFREIMIFGDLSPKPVEELDILLEEVFTPLISCPDNIHYWPQSIIDDIVKQIAAMKNHVYEVRGGMKGQTLLPLPIGTDSVVQALADMKASSDPAAACDQELRGYIEGILIKWTNQINDVLNEDSNLPWADCNFPGPIAEIEFWESRCNNLESIYCQLRDPRVKAMASILELSNSVYFQCYKKLFRTLVAAVSEARDISLYLKPVQRHFARFESTDFIEARHLIRPFMYCTCLVWANCKYYCNNPKIILLLKEIVNMMLNECSKTLEPSGILQGEADEGYAKVSQAISNMEHFKEIFDEYRANLDQFSKKGYTAPTTWTFHPDAVFGRYNIYMERLRKVQYLLGTAVEYFKLEKVEIAGVIGRQMGHKILDIFNTFSSEFGNFGNIEYDPLKPECDEFEEDLKGFTEVLDDLDRRLAAVFKQAFDDIHTVESLFKLVYILCSLPMRPLIKEIVGKRFQELVDFFEQQCDHVKVVFDEGKKIYKEGGVQGMLEKGAIDRFFPPTAGALMWIHKMRSRITTPYSNFVNVTVPVLESEHGAYSLRKYEEMLELLDGLQKEIFGKWASQVPADISATLPLHLLTRDPNTKLIALNFDDRLAAALKETRYIKQLEIPGIPQSALNLLDRASNLQEVILLLQRIVEWYNYIREKCDPVEFELIREEVEAIDVLLESAISSLDWNGDNKEYAQEVYDILNQLQERVVRAQQNIQDVIASFREWGDEPLFFRKGKKETNLIGLDDHKSNVKRRYVAVKSTALFLDEMMEMNFKLFFNIPIPVPPPPPPEPTESELAAVLAAAAAKAAELAAIAAAKLLAELYADEEEEEDDIRPSRRLLWGEPTPEPSIHEGEIEADEGFDEHDQVPDDMFEFGENVNENEDILLDEIGAAPEDLGTHIAEELEEEEGLEEIKVKLTESEQLLEDERREKWKPYQEWIDEAISNEILSAIGVSVETILKEMAGTAGMSPFFEVYMILDLAELVPVYDPSLELEQENCFYAMVENLLQDIANISMLVPRVAKHYSEPFYQEDLEDDQDIYDMRFEILGNCGEAMAQGRDYANEWEKYQYLWLDDRQEFLDMFLKYGHYLTPFEIEYLETGEQHVREQEPPLKRFKEMVEKYNNLYIVVDKDIPNFHVIDGWLQIDLRPFKQALLNTICKWANMFKQNRIDFVIDSLNELEKFLKTMAIEMAKEVPEDDLPALLNCMYYLNELKAREEKTDNMFEPLKVIMESLKEYNVEFEDEVYDQLNELPDKWDLCKKNALKVKQKIAPLQAKEVERIRQRLCLFDVQQTVYKATFRESKLFNCKNKYPYDVIDKMNVEIKEFEDTMEDLIMSATLFELNIPEFKQIRQTRNDLKLIKQVWDTNSIIKSCIDDWKLTLWKKINVEDMDQECKKFTKDIHLLDKDTRLWEPYICAEDILKNLMTSLRAVNELQNPAIRERHWHELMQATKVKFTMSEKTTLADLLNLHLYRFEDEVKTIVDKAVKEMAMEKTLKDLEATWSVMNFEHETHERTGRTILKASDELIETLEESMLQLHNLMSSKFIGYFKKEFSEWQYKLSYADQVITNWFEVQIKWKYLESIFIGSEDIRAQLPEDSKRFDLIDQEFKQMLDRITKIPNVIKATNHPGLAERLEVLEEELVKCEKALNEYLDTKRVAYPRFYFISSADLLDILSNGNYPRKVNKHMAKLYDSIAKLTFTDNESKMAKGMTSKENEEYVTFKNECDCDGQVEVWLNRVTDIMIVTLRNLFREAVLAYEDKPRDIWLFDWPAQPALCGTQIWWAADVIIAFERLEEGYESALKDYQKKQINQLNSLIGWLLGTLTMGDRQKIMTICTIDVHSRDVVFKLITSKTEVSTSFDWQSQLRHRWDEDEIDCFGNICDAQFRYQYEYLGNTPRLVITPLTDRCYITLTQSLHLHMAGAPAGPAGTGKTETTKDLGRALGMMVYVFNCSEQMDYKSIGEIYKGLAQTGAWGCFDEFNRISIEVLSVVAVQVKTILDALKTKKKMFNFLGMYIALIPTIGLFITMNPGYAGRTELPENLKAHFRPCAMVVPDFELICEIMLVAEGFQDARLLARKFITLYTLCRELLSKQIHYDWGLRAIKSVLVVAGALKRSDRKRPEDQVLMRALRDFNTPKVVTDDIPVFMGLIGDLFPALDVPRKRDMGFEKVVRQSAADMKLQPEDGFVLKIVQLEELFVVRHSVFVLGFAGTGKTMVWKCLHKTHQNLGKKPMFNDISPKAVTTDELFGLINRATREWKDGLLSAILRDQANLTGNGPKWVVFDGDIDPMWIESLNTVMDDNKVLTLASNERIALTSGMRLLFEIANLNSATPATVSRAGILYINPADLGWSPSVLSWIETRTVQSEKANLQILFDKYVPPILEAMKRFKKITPITELAQIQMTCYLLECFLVPENFPADSPKEWLELYFAFSIVWGFGSALFQDQLIDWRVEFQKWWVNEFKTVKFPNTATVFHYYIDPATKKFMPWTELVKPYELDADIPLQATLVNTAETTRIRFFLDLLMSQNIPVMLVGNAGTGKSVIIAEKLSQMGDKYAVTNVPFNFYTTSDMLQCALEKPLEKKAGRNFGPPDGKTMIYFVDDMNMPEVDLYGTVQPHALIRQFFDYQHWYDRVKICLKDINDCQYVSCMNPTAGSFTIDPRLQRHFCVFAISAPSYEAQAHIYNEIFSQHLTNPLNKFNPTIQKMSGAIVEAALQLHLKMTQNFLPTAIKFHYIFNLRDLANVFQGMLFASGDCITTSCILIRLWMHESMRVYGDKLVDSKDHSEFQKLLTDITKKSYKELDEEAVMKIPNLFCHFAEAVGDPKYSAVPSWQHLHRTLTEGMTSYNDLIGAMNLVLFEDAMSHICRISRILEAPRGNALLVGVGGSGKQSLSRLAAFISSLDVFQMQLTRGYNLADLKFDLGSLYIKAGLKCVGVVFLMTDAQVEQEIFLVLINDMLASGDISELLPDEDVEAIVTAMRNEVKQAGLEDTTQNCWNFFIDRVRLMLKTILCFSPVGSTLRIRARKFPAIVNCTAINWFHEWPKEALESVSKRFLSGLKVLPKSLSTSVSQYMAYVHTVVQEMSVSYLLNERRYNYTTPKSFLELISLYTKLLKQKNFELKDRIRRLTNGITKLVECGAQVVGLQKTLAKQEVTLASKNKAADALVEVVGAEKEIVDAEKNKAAEKEAKVRIIEEDVSAKAKLCADDLAKAEPVLIAAKAALNTLNKDNLTELKSFVAPTEAVLNVCAAVLVLFTGKKKVPRDRSWKACKNMMQNVNHFMEELVYFDKEHIQKATIKALIPYIMDKDFDPVTIVNKSSAASGLCSWVINIYKFYEVYLLVEPKRRALDNANKELSNARGKMMVLNKKIKALEKKLGKLTGEFDVAMGIKMKCQAEADATAMTIDLAHRLVNGLGSENTRWLKNIDELKVSGSYLPGDVLMISCFISYVGCFTRQYRADLVNKYWLPKIDSMTPQIPRTKGLDPLGLLTDDAQIALWNNEGLPSDRMSAENATILVNSARWPLMIDPQIQGLKWIKNKYSTEMVVIRLTMRHYMDTIEKCLANGDIMLIENIFETVDAVLEPLLGRQLIKKGRIMKIGDAEMDFNPKFRLIMQTKLANPHYKPEMQAQTTLINFTVTRDGLEDQLLAEVVKAERPDLETLKSDLTKQQNDCKITLKILEDDLLARLSSAGPNILEDQALVLNLESTKKTAASVVTKVKEAKVTSVKIDEAREHYSCGITRCDQSHENACIVDPTLELYRTDTERMPLPLVRLANKNVYRPAARRSSILYFIMNDLCKINMMYQYSLKSFTVVFLSAIFKATRAQRLQDRVTNLLESITYEVYMYTARSLFEKDKLTFLAQIGFQVMIADGEIDPEELDFLLLFPVIAATVSPVDFLTPLLWGGVKQLSTMTEFNSLDREIEGSAKRWKNFVEGDAPEKEKFPQEWKSKTVIQRLCMMRTLRPDRMTYAVMGFIEEKFGPRLVDARSVDFAASYKESSNEAPIFFILSPGVDPLKDVEQLGKKIGFSTDLANLHIVSLGQGQEKVAERAIDIASHLGGWVMLMNIHLVAKWLPKLDKKMEKTVERESDPTYRLFLSADPAPDIETHIIPQGVLECSIKITNEAPTGMNNNLHTSLDNFNQETLEMCSKEVEFKAILFALCYFHAVVSERRKFGPQGWNRIYPFNMGDLTISVYVLYNYLENNAQIPWDDLRYLFGEIMYGGHITDDWDKRLCRTYLLEYMTPELVDGELMFAEGFQAPPNTDYDMYHLYIDEMLPPESPHLYGLHPNAEIGFLTTRAENMFRTIFELQPRDSAGGAADGGLTKEERVKSILEDILDKIPDEFNMEELMSRVDDLTPFNIVAFQECERMNTLMGELRRSLKEVELGILGELTITKIMEDLADCLAIDQVPPSWTKVAYPSMLGLGGWFNDAMNRLHELESWVTDFTLPATVWLGGFFNPQSFLTAIMQQTARKNEWPLDKVCLNCDVTKKQREELTAAPREGAYIHGVFMEGARWNMDENAIGDAILKELFPMMPVMFIKAVTQDKLDVRSAYECPLYNTRQRGLTFVWTFYLKSKDRPGKWTLAGVCLLLQV